MMTTVMIMMTMTTFMMVTVGVMRMIIIIHGHWHWWYWWCDQAVYQSCNGTAQMVQIVDFVKNCVFLNCSWHNCFFVFNKQRQHFHFVFWGAVANRPRVRIDGSLPAAWQDEKIQWCWGVVDDLQQLCFFSWGLIILTWRKNIVQTDVAMLKLGGSSSRRPNSAWPSCCHIMTGTANKTSFWYCHGCMHGLKNFARRYHSHAILGLLALLHFAYRLLACNVMVFWSHLAFIDLFQFFWYLITLHLLALLMQSSLFFCGLFFLMSRILPDLDRGVSWLHSMDTWKSDKLNTCGTVDAKIKYFLSPLIRRRETFSTNYWSAASLLIHVFLHAAWMKQIVQSYCSLHFITAHGGCGCALTFPSWGFEFSVWTAQAFWMLY